VINALPFEIRNELDDGAGRLILTGELDIATAPQVEEAALAMLEQSVRRLVIDLSGLTFIDSSGLRTLIVLNDRSAGEDWTFALIRPSEPSLSVFQITGADENLPFIEGPGSQ
jgi:anti-sigma B factor antagonist